MSTHLLIGLGNPGRKYELTRHNMGFLAVDQIIEKLKEDSFPYSHKDIYNSDSYHFEYNNDNLIIVKPKTHMNLIGIAVNQFYKKYSPFNIFLFYDDFNFPLGKIKIRTRKSLSNSHNGLKSIMENLENKIFIRFIIGISNNSKSTMPLRKYVLSKFEEEEFPTINQVLNKTLNAFFLSLTDPIEMVMNKFNG